MRALICDSTSARPGLLPASVGSSATAAPAKTTSTSNPAPTNRSQRRRGREGGGTGVWFVAGASITRV